MFNLSWIHDKIWDDTILSRQIAKARFFKRRIVFTNGCFDLLHPGHLHVLHASAALGEGLWVGLNSDASVQILKGSNRPIYAQAKRAEMLAALMCVEGIILFDTPTPLPLIQKIRPSVIVKGGDYQAEQVVGYEEIKQCGGEVVIIPLLEGYSTTSLLGDRGSSGES